MDLERPSSGSQRARDLATPISVVQLTLTVVLALLSFVFTFAIGSALASIESRSSVAALIRTTVVPHSETAAQAENPRMQKIGTRSASMAAFTSSASIFFPRYSGVRPTIKPATNTAMMEKKLKPNW